MKQDHAPQQGLQAQAHRLFICCRPREGLFRIIHTEQLFLHWPAAVDGRILRGWVPGQGAMEALPDQCVLSGECPSCAQERGAAFTRFSPAFRAAAASSERGHERRSGRDDVFLDGQPSLRCTRRMGCLWTSSCSISACPSPPARLRACCR
jgi:hypothetical protein